MPTMRRCEIVSNLETNEGETLFDMDNLKEVLKRDCIQDFAYCIHDKDTYTDEDEKKNPDHPSGSLKPAHIHLMLRFHQPQHIENIAKWYGLEANFIEKIHGSWESACVYLIHGNAPDKYQYSPDDVTANFNFQRLLDSYEKKQNLDSVLQRILNGDIREYNKTLEIDNIMLVQCSRQIREAFKIRGEHLQATQQNRHMECIFITGSAGVGKTTLAKQIATENNLAYFISSGSNDILDGYSQQPCIIVDDVRPSSMGLSDLLKMLDPHTACTVKSRYFNKFVNADLIILTTVLDIDEFYRNVFSEQVEPVTQLKRRCKTYIKLFSDSIYVSVWDSKRMAYSAPVMYKNTILDQYVPEKRLTKADVEDHVKEVMPFLEPFDGDALHQTNPVKESDTKKEIPETISDTEYADLMNFN